MPWYKTAEVLPPVNKTITVFQNGVRITKSYEPLEIYNGKGGLNDGFGKWWTYDATKLQDPVDEVLKGVGHVVVESQEQKIDPKIVEGKEPPSGPTRIAEGSWDNRF